MESLNIRNRCKKCDEVIKGIFDLCVSCQRDCLKKNFTSWTSGYEKIDNFIQDMQLKIESRGEIVIEWIPYNQFSDIKKIDQGDFVTIISAIWEGGPLHYDDEKNKLIRKSDEKV